MARTDIVEVIDARVPLKKAGREYKACCPFHGEKTPSFTVSPNKQFYHCFGCGAHGTALGFLMDYDHLSFPEAVEELARSPGSRYRAKQVAGQRPRPHRSVRPCWTARRRSTSEELRATMPPAVDYLKERGLSGEIAAPSASAARRQAGTRC